MHMSYTYILKCSDGSFYTGWTNCLEERLTTHNKGKGARYTKGRLPVVLVYWELCSDRNEAQRREAAIKKLTKGEKEELIKDFLLNSNLHSPL